MKKLGVVLLNMGGPTSIESVRPFLQNLFNDREIMSFGPLEFARRPLAWVIAKFRSKPVGENYAMIGGRSPLAEISKRQANALRAELDRRLDDDVETMVTIGFSYWHPFIAQAVKEVADAGCDRVLLLPLYPQFSRTTTGSAFNMWDREAAALGDRVPAAERIDAYPVQPDFIRGVSERIDEAIAGLPPEVRDEATLLFSAHGTPVSEVRQGDPYSGQVRETIAAVMELRGNDRPHHLSFQSKVGPAKWLTPDTVERTKELAAEGVRALVVVPIAFTADHIETLHELGIDLREDALHAGIEHFVVTEGLNESPHYIAALADLVQEAVARPAPATADVS